MKVAKAKGRLRGKQPKLNRRQEAHMVALLKGGEYSTTELAEAVRRVHAGLRVVDPTLATESLLGGPNPLTDRERDVLREALKGAPVATIASRVHLSQGTVRNYLSAAIGKTGTSTRVEAAQAAQQRGWL